MMNYVYYVKQVMLGSDVGQNISREWRAFTDRENNFYLRITPLLIMS